MKFQECEHLLRDREAWKTSLEDGDIARAYPSREIARDAKVCIGVAVQAYTKIIDVVNHCLGMAEPSRHGMTYQRLSRTG
jgi:hypothetical protein